VRKGVKLLCGEAKLCGEIERELTSKGVDVTSRARHTLLIDAPWGWVQGQLANVDLCRTIILSNNPCPEYKLDLLGHQPASLFTHMSLVEIVEGLEKVWQGQRVVPTIWSSLTPTERLTLRLTSNSYSNKDIARERGVDEGTIKNNLHTIFHKLGLSSRMH